jgi:hypothetical protein
MSSRSQEPQRRTGGPIGGLVKLIGTGVGAAVEYHGHRKQRKAAYDSAQASPEEEHVSAGPSTQPTHVQRSISDNLPPSYTQSTNLTSDRQLATGPPANDEKKALDDSSDSDYLSDELTPIEDDEEAWQLDEVAASTEPPSYENATREDTDAFERDIVATRELNTSPIGTLPLPCSRRRRHRPEDLPPLPQELPLLQPGQPVFLGRDGRRRNRGNGPRADHHGRHNLRSGSCWYPERA